MLYELLSQQRSGSTYLYHTLKSYLPVKQLSRTYTHEPFGKCHELDNNQTREVLDQIMYNAESNLLIKNHALHIYNLKIHHPDLYQKFLNIPKKRFVLIRHDNFQKTISSIVAKHWNNWGQQREDIQPIHIEPWLFRWTYQEII